MFKNTSGQKIRVFAFNQTTSAPVTGDGANITCKVSLNNDIPVNLTDVNPVEVEDGFYLFDLTQEETNADVLDFYPESSTANVTVIVPNHNRQTIRYSSVSSGSPGSGMDSMLVILRSIIQDLDGSIYSDESLSRLLITSALIIQREVSFDTSYTVDIMNISITPDPTDNSFILLVAYKASLLLLQSEIRSSASNSIKIVDGPSTIDLTNKSKDLKSLLNSVLEEYNLMKRDYSLSGSLGYCVITPTTVSYINRNNFS